MRDKSCTTKNIELNKKERVRKMRRFSTAVKILLILAIGCIFIIGCATIREKPIEKEKEPGSAFSNYFIDRGYDFLDMFRIQIGAPRDFRAFGAKVKVTSLAEVGFVYFSGMKAGMERRGIGIIRQKKVEGGITPIYFSSFKEIGKQGNYFLKTKTQWAEIRDRRIIKNGFFWSDGTKRPWSIGAEFEFLCFPGLDVQIYLCELGDFFFGIFGLDPRCDDVSKIKAAKVDNEFYLDE